MTFLIALSFSINVSFVTTAIAQKNRSSAIEILSKYPQYSKAKGITKIGILPIVGCFNCDKARIYEMKMMCKKGGLLLVYPSARAVVQGKVKKDNQSVEILADYIFDDKLYQEFSDPKAPKGYFINMK